MNLSIFVIVPLLIHCPASKQGSYQIRRKEALKKLMKIRSKCRVIMRKNARKESNDYLAMRCAGHISILYNSFGNVDGSLQYNKLGYDLAIKLADDDAKSSFLSNYVTYCCNNKDSVNARKYYAELLRLPVHRDKQKYEYFCLYEYARIMKCVGNYSEAQNVHGQA